MPQTFKDYGPMEVALLVKSYAPHTGGTKERALEGDIIAVRRLGRAIGTAEMSLYLWVQVEGWDFNDYAILTQPIDGFDKRRHCIPFARLKTVIPSLDLARVRDPTDKYQPCIPFDDDEDWMHHHGHKQNERVTGLRIPGVAMRPLSIEGLVFDKTTGTYL